MLFTLTMKVMENAENYAPDYSNVVELEFT